MTEEQLIEFLKSNLELKWEGSSYQSSYPTISLHLCDEEICSVWLYGVGTDD